MSSANEPTAFEPAVATPRRIVVYHQTHFRRDGSYVSLQPLISNGTTITHLILAAIHINEPPGNITLNDDPPETERNDILWAELRELKKSGVSVLGMLGGAAKGSFTRLDGHDLQRFESYYAPLRDMIRKYGFDGLDLDVEEEMSLDGIIRLIDRLKLDFGPSFLITLAPVATALMGRRHLSGFNYVQLEIRRGSSIAWYNTQFYCGWGSADNTAAYDWIIGCGWKPEKVVVGVLTHPTNGASGHTPIHIVGQVLGQLVRKHKVIGGVMGWEYFNSLPGDESAPWLWAESMFGSLWALE